MIEKPEKRHLHIGSSFDKFFADDGLLEEIEAEAVERVRLLRSQQYLEQALLRIDASR